MPSSPTGVDRLKRHADGRAGGEAGLAKRVDGEHLPVVQANEDPLTLPAKKLPTTRPVMSAASARGERDVMRPEVQRLLAAEDDLAVDCAPR